MQDVYDNKKERSSSATRSRSYMTMKPAHCNEHACRSEADIWFESRTGIGFMSCQGGWEERFEARGLRRVDS